MAWTRKYEDAEPQRVNRWLAQSGVCSRREAEGLIAQGLVTIDGGTHRWPTAPTYDGLDEVLRFFGVAG